MENNRENASAQTETEFEPISLVCDILKTGGSSCLERWPVQCFLCGKQHDICSELSYTGNICYHIQSECQCIQ